MMKVFSGYRIVIIPSSLSAKVWAEFKSETTSQQESAFQLRLGPGSVRNLQPVVALNDYQGF